ncbi:hypothetical protein [Actinophytocola sp. KF-1]
MHRTLLEQMIKERRQTFEEFAEFAEVFAREHGESGTISLRHLQRLVAGRGTGGEPLGAVRPATARLLERIFGVSVEELLSPPVETLSTDSDRVADTVSEEQHSRTETTRSAEPNLKFRAAREATPSPTTPGYSMSRAELAEAVNEHLWRTTKKHYASLDARAIGRYERGEIQWPTGLYRTAFRAVLGASTDADLGFYPLRRAGSTSRSPIPSASGSDPVTETACRAATVRRRDVEPGASRAESVGDLVGWVSDSTRQRVAERLETWDLGAVRDRGFKLRGVGRSQLAHALAEYYGDGVPHRVYVVDVEGQRVATSVLTRPEWSELALPLGPDADCVVLADVEPDNVGRIIHVDDHAVERLAEAATLGVRMTNKPLYRLLNVDIRGGVISGDVGLVPFGDYALTMDLLEREIADALAAGRPVRPGDLPLRDRRLPDLASVLDLRNRLCAGGVVGLCAIARPADPYRGPADYALLVQERSGQVVNGAGRLAVIPKGFHEPLNDVRADARIGVTLRREMEEELFGRVEVDSTMPTSRAAAPMHPGRLSEPMRWLLDTPDRLRTECTGFGLNLVSGNYEFAGLVVIDDEEFWPRFGGNIEANWESSGLQIYSSLDGDLISKLVLDESWSNEGLFAFLQGIPRLREIGGNRVRLPEVSLRC